MIDMKCYYVVNPLAGEGKAEAAIREGIAGLDNCEVYITKAPGDATEFVRKTIEENPGQDLRFVACGGDGSINEVFTGAVGKENVSVSVYPCGSGNDFVKFFGAERFRNIPALASAPASGIDVLKVGDRYSFNVTNFGFDTTVATTVNTDRAKTGHGSKNSYTKGIIKALLTSMNNKCKVWADGELMNEKGRLLLCTCANGDYVGGSFKCAPRASVNDGLIEVCLVLPISRIKFVSILDTYTKGEHLDAESCKKVIVYRQAKKVHVEAPEGFAYSLDGEIIYENSFDIEVLRDSINLAVPQ